jgi:hypothetical protein
LKLFGKGLNQQWMFMPGLDEIDGKWNLVLGGQCGAVEADAGARILWRQADDNGTFDAGNGHGVNCVRDKRFPITHADIDRQFQLFPEKSSLSEGPAGKWRTADQAVTMFHFFDHLVREGSPSGDPQQKFRHVLDGIGAAVG